MTKRPSILRVAANVSPSDTSSNFEKEIHTASHLRDHAFSVAIEGPVKAGECSSSELKTLFRDRAAFCSSREKTTCTKDTKSIIDAPETTTVTFHNILQ